jgi:hypothetical protein
VEDLSRLLPELGSSESPGPESPRFRASHPRSFCPGSPGPRSPQFGLSGMDPTRLSSSNSGVSASRFRFPSGTEL